MDIEKELKIAWSAARSMENMGHSVGGLEKLGECKRGNRIYLFWKDAEGNYWYRVRIETAEGILSERDWIFGGGKQRRRMGKRP